METNIKKICIRHSLRNFNNKNKPICESCQNLEKKTIDLCYVVLVEKLKRTFSNFFATP